MLTAAARLFAAKGVDAVRLDEVADAADVARGTLFNHFVSKGALVAAIMRPVLEEAATAAAALTAKPARAGVEGMVRLHHELWQEHRDALRVAHQMQGSAALQSLADVHQRYIGSVMRVFGKAARARLLRARSPEVAALALWKVATPLLELFCAEPGDGDEAFFASVSALLLRPPGEASGHRRMRVAVRTTDRGTTRRRSGAGGARAPRR
jgi:AcrR family transcriptional regulator